MDLLSSARMYELAQDLTGARQGRAWLAENFLKISPADRVLDVGCGPGDILAHLPIETSYVGIDLSSSYIERAKKRFKDRGRFLSVDVAELPSLNIGKFDVVMAIGVLHHLDDDQVLTFLSNVKKSMDDGARLLTVDGVWTDPQNWIAKVLLSMDRGKFVRTREKYLELVQSVFDDVRDYLKTDLARIPYSHFLMEAH